MNTYGIRSVNSDSFCYKMHADASNNEFLKNTRNIIVTIYKVHNFILNILGYIPFFCVYSGAIRAGTALLTKAIILAHNLYFDGSNESIKKWKDEAEVTANTQFARAALEAFTVWACCELLFRWIWHNKEYFGRTLFCSHLKNLGRKS